MITRLRHKIDCPKKPKFLQTIRGLVMFFGLNKLLKIVLPKACFIDPNYSCSTNNIITIDYNYSIF